MVDCVVSTPLRFAASQVADFIQLSFSDKSQTLLDVGCGDGLITNDLQERGYDIIAIDASTKAIEKSISNGIKAIHCKLEDFVNRQFDCIYMSRSLHHMPPLFDTVNKLEELTTKSARLIISDFGFELANASACYWLFEQAQKLMSEQINLSASALPASTLPASTSPAPNSPGSDFHHNWLQQSVNSPTEALERWVHRYSVEHSLWSAKDMINALTNKFDLIEKTEVPYLFNFLCDLLPNTAQGADIAKQLFLQESQLIKEETIAAVGVQWVLKKR